MSYPCVITIIELTAAFDSHLRGPSFVMEPPSRLEFSNSSGGWLDCSASGSPQPSIDWLSVDGTSVGDVGGVRRVLRNGTLVLLPFPAAAYRQDIHSTIYRCVASNTVGRVISRDVQVRAGKFIDSFNRTRAAQFPPTDGSTCTQTNGKEHHESYQRTKRLTLTRIDNETQTDGL
uniref:Ig-like domain-containing protein n=1 Tax=Anopheles christyi TaxID=43041 RepID=A0A182K427_9DIPT